MSKIVYLNGKYIKYNNAKISIEDRGLQFSDSVYEVLLVIEKKIIDFEFHLERLKYSLNELSINYKVDIIFIKPSFFFGFRYLNIIFFSNCEINLISFCAYNFFNFMEISYLYNF